jgi:hypothetical protein
MALLFMGRPEKILGSMVWRTIWCLLEWIRITSCLNLFVMFFFDRHDCRVCHLLHGRSSFLSSLVFLLELVHLHFFNYLAGVSFGGDTVAAIHTVISGVFVFMR